MEKLSKSDKVKIELRKEILQFLRQKVNDVEVGDFDGEEFEIFRQEILEIEDMIKEKDSYIKAHKEKKDGRNGIISKYFRMDR